MNEPVHFGGSYIRGVQYSRSMNWALVVHISPLVSPVRVIVHAEDMIFQMIGRLRSVTIF
jgi:hypothetical protein